MWAWTDKQRRASCARCGTVVRWLPRRGAYVRRRHEAACSGVCCAAAASRVATLRVGVGRHNTRHVTATTCHDSQELKLGMGLELELELGPGLHVLVLVHRRVLVLQLARRQHRQDVRECSTCVSCVPPPHMFATY